MIPDVTIFAMVLEKLTQEASRDWRFFHVLDERWRRYNNILTTLVKNMHDPRKFDLVKFISVKEFWRRSFIVLDEGKADATFVGNELSLNILEAVKEDLRLGNADNAQGGTTLAKHSCGRRRFDNRTKSGPTKISSNGQLIECRPPLPLEWADLYSVWNIAFVTLFKDWPYFVAKLLIPSVSGYQTKPEAYIHIRAIALHTFINFRVNYKKYQRLDWSDERLTKDLGRVNKKSGDDYIRKLARVLNSTPEKIKNKPTPSIWLRTLQFICEGIWQPCRILN